MGPHHHVVGIVVHGVVDVPLSAIIVICWWCRVVACIVAQVLLLLRCQQ